MPKHPNKQDLKKAVSWVWSQKFTKKQMANALNLSVKEFDDIYGEDILRELMDKEHKYHKLLEMHAEGRPALKDGRNNVKSAVPANWQATYKLLFPEEKKSITKKVEHSGKIEHQHVHAMQLLKPLDAKEWQEISKANNRVTKQDLLTVLGESDVEDAEIVDA